MLVKKVTHKRLHKPIIPFIRNSRKGKTLLSESRSEAARGRDRGGESSPKGLGETFEWENWSINRCAVAVTQLHRMIKTDQTLHLKGANFIIYK